MEQMCFLKLPESLALKSPLGSSLKLFSVEGNVRPPTQSSIAVYLYGFAGVKITNQTLVIEPLELEKASFWRSNQDFIRKLCILVN